MLLFLNDKIPWEFLSSCARARASLQTFPTQLLTYQKEQGTVAKLTKIPFVFLNIVLNFSQHQGLQASLYDFNHIWKKLKKLQEPSFSDSTTNLPKRIGHSSTIDQNSIRICKSYTECQSISGVAGISVWFQSHLKKVKTLKKHLSPFLICHIDLQSINRPDSNLIYIFTSF